MLDKIPVLFAPTGSGKSALSLAYAKKTGALIINMDSMQVYKEMDIGTAKPTVEEFNEYDHALYNLQSPEFPMSVYDYKEKALEVIRENLGKRPMILVGGTGLYLSSLYYDYTFREEQVGASIDEDAPIDWKNPHRVERFQKTGKVHLKEDRVKSELPLEIFYLHWDRETLYQRVNQRVDLMMKEGLLDEVTQLLEKYPLKEDSPLLKAIGYKEMITYLRGESTLEEALETLKRNTRRYAKRQITWVKHQYDSIHTLDASQDTESLLKELEHHE